MASWLKPSSISETTTLEIFLTLSSSHLFSLKFFGALFFEMIFIQGRRKMVLPWVTWVKIFMKKIWLGNIN
jgi:hypothetical protein